MFIFHLYSYIICVLIQHDMFIYVFIYLIILLLIYLLIYLLIDLSVYTFDEREKERSTIDTQGYGYICQLAN